MLEDQTTLSFALLLGELDQRPERTRRGRLEGLFRDAVRSGRLAAGTPLPASRTLAAELDCSRWVVVQAYEQLVAEGFFEARGGSRTRVASGPARPPGPPPPKIVESGAALIDLTPGQPDLAAFPRSSWLWATRRAMASTSSTELNYIEPSGLLRCKQAVIEYLNRVRGVTGHAADTHICAGSSHALGLLCRALAIRGHTVLAVEEPGWPPLRGFARGAGLSIRPIPVDEHGIQIDALRSDSEVRAVLVTPAQQFPTGFVMSSERRNDLLKWARETDSLVIEDDYDAEFRYDRRPIGCVQGLAPEHVAFISSTSKTLAPGLRLGWMVTPPTWTRVVGEARRTTDLGVSSLDQVILTELLESNALSRHLRWLRKRYSHRRQAMLTALEQLLPDARVIGAAAGLHMLVELPCEIDEDQLISRVGHHGVRLFGLRRYQPSGNPPPGLVLGFARASETAIRTGLHAVATEVASECQRRAPDDDCS